VGLHVPGNFFKVLDLQECHLQSEWSAQFVNVLRNFVKTKEWAPWDIRNHKGFLRHLVIREGKRTGERMINLVTNGFEAERMEALAAFLQAEQPEVTTLVNTIHTGKSQNPQGEPRVIFGPGVIHDEIGPHCFEISPGSFFQTNTGQAERLYEVARDFADLQPDDVLYDLYCGAGTIAIFMADAVQKVVGAELVESAVENARANAVMNDVGNCTFEAGDLKELFTEEFVERHGRPDVLVVDPPRAGMHKDVVAQIAALQPERFVYVSCNPQTQARDIDRLREAYRIEGMQPVDMFPHTPHIENVVKLARREA
jgi:23S rRNA (uracil1939-C5)-methyltransferase